MRESERVAAINHDRKQVDMNDKQLATLAHFSWHQLSMIAGLHFKGTCFRHHEGSIAKVQSPYLRRSARLLAANSNRPSAAALSLSLAGIKLTCSNVTSEVSG